MRTIRFNFTPETDAHEFAKKVCDDYKDLYYSKNIEIESIEIKTNGDMNQETKLKAAIREISPEVLFICDIGRNVF